jgi:glycosyltransferase involved in cell wall biosynthesis
MNILMMNFSLGIGGQEAHVTYLSNYLADNRHNVFIWSNGGEMVSDLRENCTHNKVPFDLLAPWPYQKLITPRFISALRRFKREVTNIIESKDINLVHCHGVAETVLMRAALNKHAIPLLYSSHGWSNDLWDWHMRYLRRCDHYIGVSEYTCQKLNAYGVPYERISNIPCGIPYKEIPKSNKIQELREYLLGNINKPGCIVVTVARLHKQKGHDILLRAIPNILKNCPESVFVFVGDGPERQSLENLAIELNVMESVRFVGAQRNVNIYLHASDIFCLPSRYEALPLAIPEAYRAGLPVVVCNVAGCGEIVEDRCTGFLIPPESVDHLAEALITLINKPVWRRSMSANAFGFGSSLRFNPSVVHGQIEDLYNVLIKKPPHRKSHSIFESFLAKLMG